MDYGVFMYYGRLWMCFVNCVFCLWICICELCILLSIERCRKSVWGYHEFSSAWLQADETTCPAIFVGHHRGRRKYMPSYFRRPPPRPTKIRAQLFSSATTEADVNSQPTNYFVGLGEADENRSFSSVPTEIVAYFRRTYFRRLFSSVYTYFRGFLAHENLGVSSSERVLRYLVHTPHFRLWYPKEATSDLIGYSDSDYAGCKIDNKCT
jgi:hypothetical protein